jgi:two-component system, chemotaxis family, sensor kinase CheA
MSEYPAVLYVEDDTSSCEIMHLLLAGDMGLEHVTIFTNSADFLSKVQALQPQPDIILLDIHVQPHDGFEMLKMLRSLKTFQQTPVIALTASVMNEEVAKLRTTGFTSVIPKPINQENFPDILNRVLKGESIWRVIY